MFCVPEERTEKISLLVFHCFALPTKQMLGIFKKTGTGAHYIIKQNGAVVKLVDEKMVAYHSGISSWREFKDSINAKSIGIELQNSLMGNKKYTRQQIDSLITLSQSIIKRYQIKPQNIVGHSDIAPFRKPDPGKEFPWRELAKAGIGIWKDEGDYSAQTKVLSKNKIEELLQTIGYNTLDLTAALYAFVIRFMPQKIETDPDIIQKEAAVFDYWRAIKPAEVNKAVLSAPKIYPLKAEELLKDIEVSARLSEIAEAYKKGA